MRKYHFYCIKSQIIMALSSIFSFHFHLLTKRVVPSFIEPSMLRVCIISTMENSYKRMKPRAIPRFQKLSTRVSVSNENLRRVCEAAVRFQTTGYTQQWTPDDRAEKFSSDGVIVHWLISLQPYAESSSIMCHATTCNFHFRGPDPWIQVCGRLQLLGSIVESLSQSFMCCWQLIVLLLALQRPHWALEQELTIKWTFSWAICV